MMLQLTLKFDLHHCGDTFGVIGIGREMTQFVEQRQGRLYCGMGQVLVNTIETGPPPQKMAAGPRKEE